jgi:hypothetical protein
MLTGELPLGKFAPPSKKVQVDVRLDDVVLHTLEKEPERRYQQVSQVKTDVETIVTGAPPPMGAAARPGAIPPTPPALSQSAVSDRVILPAFLLAFFFGVFGAHRFYVGKVRTGIVQLAAVAWCVLLIIICATSDSDMVHTVFGILLGFSICGCIAWATIDWIMILCKVFTDGNGRRLVNWWHPNPNAPQPPMPPAPPKAPVPPMAGGAPSGGGSNAMIVAPAVALIIAGCLKLFGALMGLVFLLSFGEITRHSFLFIPGFIHSLPPLAGVAVLLFSVIPATVIIYGGLEMLRLRSYGWAMAAAIVAIIFCSLTGTPAGIWALIVLLLAGVRETFANRPKPPTSYSGALILGAAAMACIFLFLAISFFTLLAHSHHGAAASSSFARIPPARPPMDSLAEQAQGNLTNTETQYDADRKRARQAELADKELEREREEVVHLANAQHLANAKLEQAQRILQIKSERYKNGEIPNVDFQQAEDELTNAEAQVAAAEEALEAYEQRMTTDATFTATTPGPPMPPTMPVPPAMPQPPTFSVAATGAMPLSYQWEFNGTTNTGVSNANADSKTNANDPDGKAAVPTEERDDVADDVAVPTEERDVIPDSEDFSKLFTTGPNGSLTMDVDRGDVQITGGDGDTVGIDVERDVRGASDDEASEILTEEHVVVEQNGNHISITARNPPALHSNSWWGWWNQPNLDVHYEITVPRGFTVQSKTSGGNIKAGGIYGNMQITTMGGELECTDIGGDVDGKTMGGSVRARGCRGALNLETMGGSITIDEFTGPDVQAGTSGGSVSADFATAPTADCDLHTMGGNVTVRLPGTSAVTLDGHTMGGGVKTDFPIETKEGFGNDSVDGPLNGGGPTLKMNTSGGNIEIWKR